MIIDTDTPSQHMTPIDTSSSSERGVAYHRLVAAPANHRWWRPLIVGVVALALYVVLSVALLVLLGVGSLFLPGLRRAGDEFLSDSQLFDMGDPWIFAFLMLTLILMIPALFAATRIVGTKPIGRLSSVESRLRLRWLRQCVVAAAAIFTVGFSVEMLVAASRGVAFYGTPDPSRAVILMLLIVLLMPLQSAAEEYIFRGYLMQSIGSWLRHPAFAIVLPVPLFVLGHGYGPLGMTDIAVFALVAGWLTWRTGGLEAAIAMHVINNVGIGILSAMGWKDINATEQSWPSLVISLIIMASFSIVVVRMADRQGIQRMTHDGDT
ncbi:MAG: lysostaphin resistance A-like protein [Arachnia sp.]